MRLADKYPPGVCPDHPDLPCFHHRPSRLHFKLDRPRLLVWAQAIQAGSATLEKVPILSPMFKAGLALKHVSKSAAAASTSASPPHSIPSTTNPLPSMPQFPQMLPFMPPFMPYGFGMPTMPYPLGNPLIAPVPGMVPMPTVSPPSSPPTSGPTIAEFCHRYDLGDSASVGLDKLGFRFGDDLNSVTKQEYTDAGFKTLEWKRVLKAYREVKHDKREHQ